MLRYSKILYQGFCGVHKERLRVHEISLKSGPNLGFVTSDYCVILSSLNLHGLLKILGMPG